MPNIETPEEFADRYWNSLPRGYSYHKGVLSAHIAARDAAIRAESAALLKMCGEVLGVITLSGVRKINQDPYPCGHRACRLVHTAEAALAALREAGVLDA